MGYHLFFPDQVRQDVAVVSRGQPACLFPKPVSHKGSCPFAPDRLGNQFKEIGIGTKEFQQIVCRSVQGFPGPAVRRIKGKAARKLLPDRLQSHKLSCDLFHYLLEVLSLERMAQPGQPFFRLRGHLVKGRDGLAQLFFQPER